MAQKRTLRLDNLCWRMEQVGPPAPWQIRMAGLVMGDLEEGEEDALQVGVEVDTEVCILYIIYVAS